MTGHEVLSSDTFILGRRAHFAESLAEREWHIAYAHMRYMQLQDRVRARRGVIRRLARQLRRKAGLAFREGTRRW